MKNAMILFLLIVSAASAQTLTLPELIALREKPQRQIRQQLIDSKWKLIDERFSDSRGFGDMAFVSVADEPMQLKVFYGLDKASQTRIQLTTKSNAQFTALKSGIAQTDLKFSSTAVDGNKTTTVFRNENVTVTIIATRAIGAAVTYDILIESNDYDPKMYNFSLGK